MKKSSFLIIITGSIIIVLFSFYSFGGYLLTKSTPNVGQSVQPSTNNSSLNFNSSLNPSNKPLQLLTYTNKEAIGNYYSLKVPNFAHVIHGNKSGSYIINLPNGIMSVELTDVPDNSSPELLFLTQLIPALESSLRNYHQINFKQLDIDGKRAWGLTYVWKNLTSDMESTKTLIEGPDAAALITYTGMKPNFIEKPILNSTLLDPILRSFNWIS